MVGEGEDWGVEGGVRPAPAPRLRVVRAVERAAVEVALTARRPARGVGVEPLRAAGSMPTGAGAGAASGWLGGGSGPVGSERAVSAGAVSAAGAGVAAARRPGEPPLRAREVLLLERGVRLTMARRGESGRGEGKVGGRVGRGGRTSRWDPRSR